MHFIENLRMKLDLTTKGEPSEDDEKPFADSENILVRKKEVN